nr:hypothetical protein [uncultured bacterium]
MYDDSASMDVEPDMLDEQARRFTSLGDDLHDRISAQAVQPLRLGSAPPAMKFAERLGLLSGPEGANGAMLDWATSLNALGDTQTTAAREYRDTEAQNVQALRGRTGDR